MQSQTRSEMFTIINEYHTLLRKSGLKAAPDKTFFFLKKVKFLGHVISPEGNQPIAKRVNALRNLKWPQSKRDVMKVLGCLGFYSCYIKNLRVDSQAFYELIKNSTTFHWTEEHETLINSTKERIHKDTVLAVPSTDYPFHIHVDSSNVGTDCILIQQFLEVKRIISFNSRVFGKGEQKCSLSIENYAQLYQLSRHTNSTLLDHEFLSISIVIINQFFIYRDAKDNYHIAFSNIRWSLQNSRTWRPFGRQARNQPFQIFSAETSRSKIIKCTNCDSNVFRAILSFATNMELRSHTKSNMKTTLTIPAMTSIQ